MKRLDDQPKRRAAAPIKHPSFFDSLRVGFFLAVRQLWRTNRGTSALIVFIMTLTFLNLVVVNGILIGLVEGSSIAYRTHYSGDVFLTTLPNKAYIERSQDWISSAQGYHDVVGVSARYLTRGRVEANYRTRTGPGVLPDAVSAEIVGISPADEDLVAHMEHHVVEGRYLAPEAANEVLIGTGLLAKYSKSAVPGQSALPDVKIGDKVRLVIGNETHEVTVRGFVDNKITQVKNRVFMLDRDLRVLLNRTDLNVGEVAVKLVPGADPVEVKGALLRAGAGQFAVVQTWEEAQGDFFKNLNQTFVILGNVIGSIALVVAGLTVFIVVLINALTRKKFIGIMKGIGIGAGSIALAYVMQAFVYAAIGTAFGSAILYGVIKPYIDANPIDFPFSDGVLAVPPPMVLWRVGLLLVMTMLAGYFPARYIIRKNTLDTILGR